MTPRMPRRALLALLLSLAVVPVARAADTEAGYAPQKVVYHNDGGLPDNAKYFRKILRNAKNHMTAIGKDRIELRMVNHGDGVAMLQMANTEKDLAEQIDGLRAAGVKFLVCKNTLTALNIDWHTLYGVSEQDLVLSGVAELVSLQQQGFVYVHP